MRGTRSRSTDRPYAAPLSPEVKWYLETRGYVLESWQKPLWRSREPRDVPGAVFDPQAVDHAIGALSKLRHTQGKWAGKAFKPDAWQVAFVIAPIFGWLREDESGRMVRIIRQAWIEVPRKNGKTTISSGLALILAFADGEQGAQVFAAAGSKDQAKLAYDPAKLIAKNSPDFRAAGIDALERQIVRASDGSYFKAVASMGDLLQGTNPNGYIVDEMHVHKTLDVIQALESGTGARDQPLGLVITTADAGKRNSPYAQRRDRAEKICKRIIDAPSEYVVIFAAPKSADPFKESTWKRANPGYGVSPTKAFMESAASKAKDSPVELATFLRLNLNVRTKQETKFISQRAWDANRKPVDEAKLIGRFCHGGLDLASVSDLSAFCLLFPNIGGTFDAVWRFWTPEDNLPDLDKRTGDMASVWAAQGFLTLTPGNVMDYDFIRAQIKRDADLFQIATIGYDPWNSSQLVNDLVDDGMEMVKVRQGYATMSPALKQVKRLVLSGIRGVRPGIAHLNPVADWCVDNLAVSTDPAGNVKPDKARSGEKIDGVSALVTAMSEAMNEELKRSAYTAEDTLIIA